ncbi:MAG: methyltransferase domain-containing protein [Pseudomonadota bacterium]
MTDLHENMFKPAQFLVENVNLLPKGQVLDVAMGSGANAVYLARMGFEVEGVDISAEAVNTALELARKSGVNLKARLADLESNYRIRKSSYDVIICFKYLQRSLIQQLKDGLRTGGMVVYETFIVDQARFGKPKNPDHLLKHNELLDLFRDFRCLRYREGIFESRKAIASIIAEKT